MKADEGEEVTGLRAELTLEDTDKVIERLPNAEVRPEARQDALRSSPSLRGRRVLTRF